MVPSSFLVRSLFVYVSGLEIRSVFLVYFTFSLSCSMDSIVGSTSVVGSVSYAGRHVQSFWVIAELASFLCSLVFCFLLVCFTGILWFASWFCSFRRFSQLSEQQFKVGCQRR